MTERDFRLRSDNLRDLLDRFHRNHRGFAEDLEISAGYWSQLLNGHRRLTPALRRRLLEHQIVKQAGLSGDDLWTLRRAA